CLQLSERVNRLGANERVGRGQQRHDHGGQSGPFQASDGSYRELLDVGIGTPGTLRQRSDVLAALVFGDQNASLTWFLSQEWKQEQPHGRSSDGKSALGL